MVEPDSPSASTASSIPMPVSTLRTSLTERIHDTQIYSTCPLRQVCTQALGALDGAGSGSRFGPGRADSDSSFTQN
jgi:hypothetical protein